MRTKARDLVNHAHNIDPADPDIRKAWLLTLKRPDRIKELDAYLASTSSNLDKEQQENLGRYLEILKNREQNPNRNCHLVSKLPSTETPLARMMIDPYHLRGYGLNVKFNNQNAHLLLDTGASGLLVKRSIAEKAGIQKLTDTKMGGIGDKEDAAGYIGYAD